MVVIETRSCKLPGMPRTRRVFFPGLSVHVTHRGINRAAIFGDDLDREQFLLWFREAMTKYEIAIHGLTLMSNHYHAIVTPSRADALPNAMRDFGSRYTRYFNRRYGRIGTMWTGRYRGIPIGDEVYWLNCLRYIELNPLRAHMVNDPAEYLWSSYLHHAVRDAWPWLVDHGVYLALGRTPEERRRAFHMLSGQALSETDLARQRLAKQDRPATCPIAPVSEIVRPHSTPRSFQDDIACR